MKRARGGPPEPGAQQRVVIDVGGTKFTTTVSTISHSSYLAGMVDLAAWDSNPTHSAEIFLDRDPDIFASLLRLMRQMPRVIGLIPRDPFICASLIAEADFFGVDALLQHVKVKAYYNSRRVGEDRPEMDHESRRREGEDPEAWRERRKLAWEVYRNACRRVRKAFQRKDEAYAVERFDAVYGSVSDALEDDVLPKYFLEPKPLRAAPEKRVVQLLPADATSWFLVGDIFDARYGYVEPQHTP